MRITHVIRSYAVLHVLLVIVSLTLSAQSVGEMIQYTVQPSCDSPDPTKPTAIASYYLQLDITSLDQPTRDFEIAIDRENVLQFTVTQEDLPYRSSVGPFPHSKVGGTYIEYLIRSLDSGAADTLYLPEVFCGGITHNGLNAAGYFCRSGGGIIAQVKPEALNAPEQPEKIYIYVLVERGSQILVNRNFSGYFENVEDLQDYEVHAFSVSFEEQAQALNSMVIGEVLDQDDFSFCYALCGIFDVHVDCTSFDLSLEKVVDGTNIYALGDTVKFNITVRNDGTVTAYDIVAEDYSPDALEFLSAYNQYWHEDLTSSKIDSLQPGASITLPIYFRVVRTTPDLEIVNTAEIIFATDIDDHTNPAFDSDSMPGNQGTGEDDQDQETITVLQNLCAISFDVGVDHEAICEGEPMRLMAMIYRANDPLSYTWRYNGEIVSHDSIYEIFPHGPEDVGTYDLTIIDGIGCTAEMKLFLEPVIKEDRFSCYNDVNVAVNGDCSVSLQPDMLTSADISAINDYHLIMRDEQGREVDLHDLSAYSPGTTLEAMVLHPCTGEIMCWSNIHLEYKGEPTANVYNASPYALICPLVTSTNPTEIIATFNELQDEPLILDGLAYLEAVAQNNCLQTWEVKVVDQLIRNEDPCLGDVVRRIYTVDNQELQIPVDTAYLELVPMDIDSLILPSDVSGLDCSDGTRPSEVMSYPSYVISGVEVPLTGAFDNRSATFCNTGITYSDQYVATPCAFGASKIIRTWRVLDWCTNERKEAIQFLFIKDEEAPAVSQEQLALDLVTAPFACFATLNVRDHINYQDNCDAQPVLSVVGYDDPQQINLDIGVYDLEALIVDQCGNQSTVAIHVQVQEETPPAAILSQDIAIGISQTESLDQAVILASVVDAGSHDHQCGPVTIEIARKNEITQIALANDQWPVDQYLGNCITDLSRFDQEGDGYITQQDIYRHAIQLCCQDIGQTIIVTARVTDESGNVSYADVSIEIQAKLEGGTCDDGDPCTINDQQYGDCPCQGQPDLSDFDGDQIVDCQDEEIVICLNDQQLTVAKAELQDYIDQGATGGPCTANAEMAMIAGEVFTPQKKMIEHVTVSLNYDRTSTTEADGYYMFDNNMMYQDYELLPERNDDHLNGITALDLVLIQEHILGTRLITDPYLLIAADVNDDGKVSALDMIGLRRVLLGHRDELEHNQSWRFVIENYEFDDRTDLYDYQEVNVINDLDHSMMDENWIGIKIGDVNASAIPNSEQAGTRSHRSLVMHMPNTKVEKGDEIKIPISLASAMGIRSWQMNLSLDGISLLGIISGDINIAPAQYRIDTEESTETLSLAWSSEELVTSTDELVYLHVAADRSGALSDMIELNDFGPRPYVGDQEYEDIPFSLQWEETKWTTAESQVQLHQNQPNPFNGQTIIQFDIPQEGDVEISFFNNAGVLLHQINGHYHPGVNAVLLTYEDLQHWEGVVYYQLRYGDKTLSRKMVVTH